MISAGCIMGLSPCARSLMPLALWEEEDPIVSSIGGHNLKRMSGGGFVPRVAARRFIPGCHWSRRCVVMRLDPRIALAREVTQ